MRQCAVILAGGSGKRLWPLSRNNLPKQVMPLPTGQTLLEHTIHRIDTLIPREHRFISTAQQYSACVRTVAGELCRDIIVEPALRNTAPAIWHSCMQLSSLYPDDAVVLFIPADHYIEDTASFQQALTAAYSYAAEHDMLALVGVPQHYPAVQFGCIEYDEHCERATSLYAVKRFHEKPPLEDAVRYFTHKNMLWNTGIVCARLSVLLHLFRTYCPEYWSTAYEHLVTRSFDYAILEHHPNSVVVRGQFTWQDVGTLASFIPTFRADTMSYVEIAGATHNTVLTHKPVIIGGISDAYIIETEDALVILHKSVVHSSDQLTEELVRRGWEKYV